MMTGDQKSAVLSFLDLADDYLRDGIKRPPREYHVSPDREAPAAGKDSLETIAAGISSCKACKLCQGRKNVVPGEGAARPLVMVIGEGPGADEDSSGRPFVGRAGQLLDKMLAAIGLSRDRNCYIANVVKCRPPGNRTPRPEETAACLPFLRRQITLLNPRMILTVGNTAFRALIPDEAPMAAIHGKFFDYASISLLPTYHPSALLRDETKKRPAWEDLKTLRARLAKLDSEYAASLK
jgi:DNA polymerase